MLKATYALVLAGLLFPMMFGDTVDPRSERVALVDLKATFSGTVKDESGSPIEGAEISLNYGPTEDQKPSQGYYSPTAGVSGIDGSFSFTIKFRVAPDVTTINVSMWAECTEYLQSPRQSFDVSAGTTLEEIQFELELGGVVKGQVTDQDGNAVPGAEVRATTQRPEKGDGRSLTRFYSAVCDDEGNYRLPGLPYYWLRIDASCPGYLTEVSEELFEVKKDHSPQVHDLKLSKVTAVTADLKTSDSKKISDVSFVFHLPDAEPVIVPCWLTLDGHAVSGLPPMDATELEIRAEGYKSTGRIEVALKPNEHFDLGEITLEAEPVDD